MRIFTPTIFLIACICAVPARAASFNCAKATTAVERMICGDRQLSGRDSLMAKLFAAAKRDDAKVSKDQQDWLAAVRTCGDATCVRQRYDERIATLLESKGGQTLAQHFYTRGANGNDGSLSVAMADDGVAAVSIASTYVGPGGADSGDVNADGASGVVQLGEAGGQIMKDQCEIGLRRLGEDGWRVTQAGTCAFAEGVTLAGTYRR